MGIRCDQFRGLNEWARNYVQGGKRVVCREKVVRTFPDGHEEITDRGEVTLSAVISVECGTFEGMFGDQYPLKRYHFPDGSECEEAVQASPWSSGPVFFLALKEKLDSGRMDWIPESLWTEKELEEA